MPTIRQLARLAGVSIATVSRALSNHPEVSEATRKRIIELAERYKYRPNRLASGMITGKPHSIGCLVPNVEAMYCSRILKGVLEEAFTNSYHVITLQTFSDIQRTKQALEVLIEQRVEGVVLETGHYAPIPIEILNELWSHGIVPVSIDYTPTAKPIDCVTSDEQAMAQLAVDYLTGLGHREIAFIGPLNTHTRTGRGWEVNNAMRRKGLSTEYFFDYPRLPPVDLIFNRLFTTPPYPTAVIANSDEAAAVLILYMYRKNWRIPRDVSILGYGNQPISEYLLPGLTTIDQSPELIGKMAIDLLDELINAGHTTGDHQPRVITAPQRLIIRESCAKPPTR